MGVIEYFVFVLVVAFVAYVAVFALDHLAPGHPPLFNSLIWFVAALIVLLTLARAMGLAGVDPQIPRLR